MESITVPTNLILGILRLALAALCGAAIGFDREVKQKPAGLRTHALVALGSALASLTSLYLSPLAGEPDTGAVSRVIQGLVAGIGFVGGGVILRLEDSKEVRGLTT